MLKKNFLHNQFFFYIIAVFVLMCLLPSLTNAKRAAEKYYYSASACYKNLKKYPKKLTSVDEWLKCIHMAEAIYTTEPNGPWASAGLFQTGSFYYALFQQTKNKDYITKAEDHFQTLLNQFPLSQYATKATDQLIHMIANHSDLLQVKNECKCPKKKEIIDKKKDNTAKQMFFKAESCSQRVKNNKSISEWQTCIQLFDNVFQYDPKGRWAAAGLFYAGKLNYELNAKIHDHEYIQSAANYFQTIIINYPESVYCHRSTKVLDSIMPRIASLKTDSNQDSNQENLPVKKSKTIKPEDKTKSTVDKKKDAGARDLYFKAEKIYKQLKRSDHKEIEKWNICIAQFMSVYQYDPDGRWAAAGLYRVGQLNLEAYYIFKKLSYLEEAENAIQKIRDKFPINNFKDKTTKILKELAHARKMINQKSAPTPTEISPPVQASFSDTQFDQPAQQSKTVYITGIQYKTNLQYTRIIIYCDRSLSFRHKLNTDLLYSTKVLTIDCQPAVVLRDVNNHISIHDGLVKDVKVTQRTAQNVQVDLDLDNYQTYKVFSLKKPFRIYIDVRKSEPNNVQVHKNNSKKKPTYHPSIAKQLALNIQRIVIDPGHGGKDSGAIGYIKSIYEKDVVLAVAKKLARKIKQEIHCDVLMTRTTDTFLSLEDRTAIANQQKADLFVSIHTNAHPDSQYYGIETYYLNLATDDDAIRVAALENAISGKKMSDLDTILHSLMQNAKINESSRLSGFVQTSICTHMKKEYSQIKNNGVKQAPFYVLMGAEMPSILIEIGFISNKRDCERLINSSYQNALSESIVQGIKLYIQETNPSALNFNDKNNLNWF